MYDYSLLMNYNPYLAYYNYAQPFYAPNYLPAQYNITNPVKNITFRGNEETLDFSASEQIRTANEPHKMSKGSKWAIGLGVTAIAAAGIYFATRGKIKGGLLNPQNKFIDGVKKVKLNENISLQEFKTKEDAVKFAKETLQIKDIDENMPLEALNDTINSIAKISNKNHGELYMTPKIKFAELEETIAQMHIKQDADFGALTINKNLYNVEFLDKKLEQHTKELLFNNERPTFEIYTNQFVHSICTFNGLKIVPDAEITELLKKVYKKTPLTITEKRNLLLSMHNLSDKTSLVKDAPLNIFKEIEKQQAEYLTAQGIKIDFEALSKKSIQEQSQELKTLLEKLNKQRKFINVPWEYETIDDSIFHEFGHLQDIVINKDLAVKPSENIKRYSTREFFEKNPEHKMPEFLTSSEEQNIAGKVSDYATEGIGEFIAEAYQKMVQGITLDKDVMALYKKYKGPMLN